MRQVALLGVLAGLLVAGCGSTSPRCLRSNCAGCCSADDVCVKDTSPSACGRGGLACVACGPSATCSGGQCVDMGSGGGGAMGGGAGGGGGGGGGAPTGGGGGAAGGGGGLAGPGRVVINELDYDNVGTDDAEFIELFNPGTTPVSLSDASLVLVNGADSTSYLVQPLAALTSLAPGEYLVVGTATVVASLPAGARSIPFVASTDNVQNGAPDAVALVSGTSTLLDAVSYEGEVSWRVNGVLVPLAEGGSPAPADSPSLPGSLARRPNGRDTNVNGVDFAFVSAPTPGAPNP